MANTTQRDEFLAARPRLAMLTTLRADGSPITVPVWYEWDGRDVSIFSSVSSPKLRRIERDPRVSILMANDVDEPEYWVAFEGDARVEADGGLELAERLAPSYWDLDDPERMAVLDEWRGLGSQGLCRIVVTPARIREFPTH